MTCNTIYCKHCKRPHIFSFDFDAADGETIHIVLCESCYDALKGAVLQDILGTAFQEAMRGLGRFWFSQYRMATDE